MFFSFKQVGTELFTGKKTSEASINLAGVSFVEFGAVKDVPYANVYLRGHTHVITVLGEDVERLRQAIAATAAPTASVAVGD